MRAREFDVLGRADIMGPLKALAVDVRKRKSKVLLPGALVLERALKTVLSQPGRGRTYYVRRSKKTGRRYWSTRPPGRKHVASAPGQPPAVDEGLLRGSIGHGELPSGGIRVGTTQRKARTLDKGGVIRTRNGLVHIKPRPFMDPALKAAEKAMGDAAAGPLRDGLGRAG